ncbi:hypothetical protein QBC44DRAFT_334900 [Cladorrhinum sp. PSN332]|nr:hypothetical protein QBC44DRAFT_334900 [Cladorrhinum sp. PSN332]
MSAETDKIDVLLERYLTLLDSYAQLRNSLNGIQAGMYQHLARANFSADRGIRYYGQDYYDERMQAARRISITSSSHHTPSTPVFAVKTSGLESATVTKSENTKDDEAKKEGDTTDNLSNSDDDASKEKTESEKKSQKSTDPLRWYGILTPLHLRQAQSNAIKAVEDIIPQLASISAEMASVELEVRRARKRRAKANKEEERKKLAELEKDIGGLEANSGGKDEVVA